MGIHIREIVRDPDGWKRVNFVEHFDIAQEWKVNIPSVIPSVS
jgi:hypothetical protein